MATQVQKHSELLSINKDVIFIERERDHFGGKNHIMTMWLVLSSALWVISYLMKTLISFVLFAKWSDFLELYLLLIEK